MHRASVNQCDIGLKIICESPFSVLEGRYGKKKSQNGIVVGNTCKALTSANPDFTAYPDNIPVSRSPEKVVLDALLGVGGEENPFEDALANLDYYLPGASLRGVLRSYAEKILRTLSDEAEPICCNPFEARAEKRDRFCGKWLEGEKQPETLYQRQCPVCSLFGSTSVAGRIRVTDFTVSKEGHLTIRDSVPLDRFTGGVVEKVGPFRSLLLDGYIFEGALRIHNFQCLHLGLMAYVLRDLCEGRIPLGWGKAKGYGGVSGEISSVALSFFGRKGLLDKTLLQGIGLKGYETSPPHVNDQVTVPTLTESENQMPFRYEYNVSNPEITGSAPFWAPLADHFNEAAGGFLPVNHARDDSKGEAS